MFLCRTYAIEIPIQVKSIALVTKLKLYKPNLNQTVRFMKINFEEIAHFKELQCNVYPFASAFIKCVNCCKTHLSE